MIGGSVSKAGNAARAKAEKTWGPDKGEQTADAGGAGLRGFSVRWLAESWYFNANSYRLFAGEPGSRNTGRVLSWAYAPPEWEWAADAGERAMNPSSCLASWSLPFMARVVLQAS